MPERKTELDNQMLLSIETIGKYMPGGVIACRAGDPMELLYPKENPVFEKYDEFVPEALVRRGFACGVLDVAGMRERVQSWGIFAAGEPDR